MKKLIIGIIGLFFLFSCTNKKTKIDPFTPLTAMVDSAVHEQVADSIVEIEAEEPVPGKADEIFDDFVFSFALDDRLQRSRIVFPLAYYKMDTPVKIEKQDWEHDSLFISQRYYTLLFDKEEDMELVQDTSLNSVRFEWIDMKKHTVKKYYFERKKGAWLLEAINEHGIEETENEDFIDFFYRFVNDTVFQSKRIHEPLLFVTNDPDDDFAIIETTIEPAQWLAFMPVLPGERLTNIDYGQKNSYTSRSKILTVKGIDNGFFSSLYFRRNHSGIWKLYKFEDLSN